MDCTVGTTDSSISCAATPKPAASPVRFVGSVPSAGSMSPGLTPNRTCCALPHPKSRGYQLTPS